VQRIVALTVEPAITYHFATKTFERGERVNTSYDVVASFVCQTAENHNSDYLRACFVLVLDLSHGKELTH